MQITLYELIFFSSNYMYMHSKRPDHVGYVLTVLMASTLIQNLKTFYILIASNFRTVLWSYKSKKGGKDQESIQSSTTPDPGYYMGKWQKHNYSS